MAFLQDCASGWCRGLPWTAGVHTLVSFQQRRLRESMTTTFLEQSLAHIVNHIQNRIRDPQLNLKQIKWAGHIHFFLCFHEGRPCPSLRRQSDQSQEFLLSPWALDGKSPSAWILRCQIWIYSRGRNISISAWQKHKFEVVSGVYMYKQTQ